jgi:hypothetical protein
MVIDFDYMSEIIEIIMEVNLIHYTFTLMMEAAGTSETSVNFYQSTRLNNPEELSL